MISHQNETLMGHIKQTAYKQTQTSMSNKDKVLNAFTKAYGTSDGARVFFAPGRVNLIGEHTDYNGGHVFPCALTLGTYIAGRKRDDRKLRFYSVNFTESGVIERDLDSLEPLTEKEWCSYIEGVIWAFLERGMEITTGLDVAVFGDIPAGAGLSSSASLEVAAGAMLRGEFGFDVSNKDIAIIGQQAENVYCGLNCGIMDQFASAMGKEDNAVFLDTDTLDYEYAPLPMDGKKLVITNTNKKHSLVDSAYNDRRRECEEALAMINGGDSEPVSALCKLTPEEFEERRHLITDPVALRRARHEVTENERTIKAVSALKAGDLKSFGQLMNESHESLKTDFEVSCEELDVLAETAQKIPGVYGSRMTGGGFGGCTVSLVDANAVETFEDMVGKTYEEKIGYSCSFYIVSAGGGPREL